MLIALFGAYAIISGILEFVAMVRAMNVGTTWWTHLLIGVFDLAAGLAAFAYPGVTVLVLLYIIAFWAIIVGVIEIVAAFASGLFLLVVGGVIAVLFGLLLLANPGAGALAYVMVIGVFAIVRGILLLVHAIRAPEVPTAT